MEIRSTVSSEETIIDTYLRDIGRYPLLSPEEEVALARQARGGDAAALDQLVRANLRFVVSVAKKYAHLGVPMEDLINEGNIGLIKAAQRFDPDRGFKFVSYAVWWIRQSILQSLTNSGRTVRLPANRAAIIQRVNRIARTFMSDHGRTATTEEIAGELGLSVDEVEEALHIGAPAISLDDPISTGPDRVTHADILVDDRRPSPDETVMGDMLSGDVARAVATLPEREQLILRKYFGLDGEEPLTLEKIGGLLGCTRERVRQLKEQALEKLRQGSRLEYLEAHQYN